jgi:hypothetical protein
MLSDTVDNNHNSLLLESSDKQLLDQTFTWLHDFQRLGNSSNNNSVDYNDLKHVSTALLNSINIFLHHINPSLSNSFIQRAGLEDLIAVLIVCNNEFDANIINTTDIIITILNTLLTLINYSDQYVNTNYLLQRPNVKVALHNSMNTIMMNFQLNQHIISLAHEITSRYPLEHSNPIQSSSLPTPFPEISILSVHNLSGETHQFVQNLLSLLTVYDHFTSSLAVKLIRQAKLFLNNGDNGSYNGAAEIFIENGGIQKLTGWLNYALIMKDKPLASVLLNCLVRMGIYCHKLILDIFASNLALKHTLFQTIQQFLWVTPLTTTMNIDVFGDLKGLCSGLVHKFELQPIEQFNIDQNIGNSSENNLIPRQTSTNNPKKRPRSTDLHSNIANLHNSSSELSETELNSSLESPYLSEKSSKPAKIREFNPVLLPELSEDDRNLCHTVLSELSSRCSVAKLVKLSKLVSDIVICTDNALFNAHFINEGGFNSLVKWLSYAIAEDSGDLITISLQLFIKITQNNHNLVHTNDNNYHEITTNQLIHMRMKADPRMKHNFLNKIIELANSAPQNIQNLVKILNNNLNMHLKSKKNNNNSIEEDEEFSSASY